MTRASTHSNHTLASLPVENMNETTLFLNHTIVCMHARRPSTPPPHSIVREVDVHDLVAGVGLWVGVGVLPLVCGAKGHSEGGFPDRISGRVEGPGFNSTTVTPKVAAVGLKMRVFKEEGRGDVQSRAGEVDATCKSDAISKNKITKIFYS